MNTTLFPAYAGMNRQPLTDLLIVAAVPRLRGDEPRIQIVWIKDFSCSPPTRG